MYCGVRDAPLGTQDVPDSDGVLMDWGVYGPLLVAVRGLAAERPPGGLGVLSVTP